MAASLRTRSAPEFNSLPSDGKHESIQVGNGFVTADGTGTPQLSPLAYSTTIIDIIVPKGAVQIVCFPSTDMRISEVSNQASYDVIPATTKETIPCAQMSDIYIKRDSADGSLRFKFIFV